MNDNDIPDHLLSQVLDMYEEQGRRPIGFMIGFDDGPTDQVLSQALDEYESRGKASNAPNFDFVIDTLLPEIPTMPRFAFACNSIVFNFINYSFCFSCEYSLVLILIHLLE